MAEKTIKEITLRELIEAEYVRSACVVGRPGGFTISVRYNDTKKTLANSRGGLRTFASLNTAADFLRKLGFTKFEVDATDYEPGRLRAPRPDRAEALRKSKTNEDGVNGWYTKVTARSPEPKI